MQVEDILNQPIGSKLFLLGNEAIVRGFIEAGVSVATTYPGTPSSEIGNVLHHLAKKADIYFEFSVNEMVAFQIAAAAASTGIRAVTFMKHVGLNVAADALMSSAYVGTQGGFLIISADDPSMFSSQNEQDNRYYAQFAGLPLLEPNSPTEARDMVKYGIKLSEELQIPVILRTTTRINHVRGIVILEEVENKPKKGYFNKNPRQFVPIPSYAFQMHPLLLNKLTSARNISDNSPLNTIEKTSLDTDFGVIASGIAYNYVRDAIDKWGLNADVLKLGFTYPLPLNLIEDFVSTHTNIIIVEELEPLVEKEVRVLAQQNKLSSNIRGKYDNTFPRVYEYTPDIVEKILVNLINQGQIANPLLQTPEFKLPNRPPVLCPGCSHRATFYSVKKALQEKGIKDAIFPSDIGCYTLGIQPPYHAADYVLCMGSSVGTAGGFFRATNQKVISFIGDSTFYHAGITPLLNAIHNKHQFLLIILDNLTTAMTGHQPHPGSNIDGMGEDAPRISLENVIKSIGVDWMKIVDPYNLDATISTIKEALGYQGVSVIISRRACSLLEARNKRKSGSWKKVMINTDFCSMCEICIQDFSCPAIFKTKDLIQIDSSMCDGCGVCINICPAQAMVWEN